MKGEAFWPKPTSDAPAASGTAIFCDGFESGNISGWGGAGSICTERIATHPTYGSEGRLFGVQRGGISESVLYFNSRPVTIVRESTDGTIYSILTADHLGTPILATTTGAAVIWSGGLEPFGRDWNGAQVASIFLRLPGQWVDYSWQGSSPPNNLLYNNAYRWYSSGVGHYASPDPLPPFKSEWAFAYSFRNPLKYRDTLGLY